MTPIVYNSSLTVGVACIGSGAGAQWGWPVGLMAVGALVLGLTLFAARMAWSR